MLEALEPRRVMSAVAAVDDSYTVAQQQMMMAAAPVVMDVLANDTSTGGQMSIVSVSTPMSGSVSIQHDSMSAMYGMTPQPDKLLFTPSYGFTGTESFTYTVANSAGDHATATVTLTVSPANGSSGSGSGSGGYGMTMPTPPQVTSLMNNSGSTDGGTSVMISGSGFSQATQVMFGSSLASSFTVNSDSSITAVAPPHMQGQVDVLVVSNAGTSSVTLNDHFQYQTPVGLPTVSNVSPGTETISGGDTITITGTGFSNVTAVTIDGIQVSGFMVTSPTTITAIAPAHMSGQTDVRVTTTAGTSEVSANDKLTYTSPVLTPVIVGLSSSTGTTDGGTAVTILGSNFTNITSVWFGNQQATSFMVNSPTSITAITPMAMAGVVDVTVTNATGTSGVSPGAQFTFQSPAPTITGLSTHTGTESGGTSVTISGTNFHGVTGVYFGSVAATSYMVMSPTSISVVAPPEATGTVDITVVTGNGTSSIGSADQFTVTAANQPPTVTGVTTMSDGHLSIAGTNFAGVTAVSIGGMNVSYIVNSPTSITASSPSGLSGTQDITVTTSAGTSAVSAADQITVGQPGSGSTGSGSTGSGSTGSGSTGSGSTGSGSTGSGSTGSGSTGSGSTGSGSTGSGSTGSGSTGSGSTGSGSTGSGMTGSGTSYSVAGGTIVDGVFIVSSSSEGSHLGGKATVFDVGGPTSIPVTPSVPTNHPVYNSVMDYANGTMSFSMSDGGTMPAQTVVSTTTNPDGTTLTETMAFGEETFAISTSSISSMGSYMSTTHIELHTKWSMTETLSAANGTGYSHQTSGQTDIIWDSSTANASNGSSSGTFFEDMHTVSSSSDQMVGLKGVGSATMITTGGQTTNETESIISGATTNGTTVGTFTMTDQGSDADSTSSVTNSSSEHETGSFVGSDVWTSSAIGTFTWNADGTHISSSHFSNSTAGKDKYSENDSNTWETVTPDQYGSTTVDDTTSLVITGYDNYTVATGGTYDHYADGTVHTTQTRTESDSGDEDIQSGDSGTITATETLADGTVITYNDVFADSNDDDQKYDDNDNLVVGEDKWHSGSSDQDKFSTSNTSKITITSTAASGAVTTTTLIDSTGDVGETDNGDTLDDDETLSAIGEDLGDKYTFDDSTHADDKSFENLSIVIHTLGLVGTGDFVDSTEVISLLDKRKSVSDVDDPGTEADAASSAVESDTSQATSEFDDDLQESDLITSKETRTLADGTVITTQSVHGTRDHLISGENDHSKDVHTANPGATGEIKADDDTFEDVFHESDDYGSDDETTVSIVIPIAGGFITAGSSSSSKDDGTESDSDDDAGETNTANPGANTETDSGGISNSDAGYQKFTDYFNLLTTDPVTGVTTSISASDNDVDNFTNSFGESYSTGTAYSIGATSGSTDEYDNKSSFSFSMQGKIGGMTFDIGENLSLEDIGGSNDTDTLTSAAKGSDSEIDKFGSHDNVTEGGGGHSNVTMDYSSDDGHGNSITFHEVDKSNSKFNETFGDGLTGEEDIGVAGGKVTSDGEHDTESSTAAVDAEQHTSSIVGLSLTSTDPVTGSVATFGFTDSNHDDAVEHEQENATDLHTDGTASSDKISGSDDLTEEEDVGDEQMQTLSLSGHDTNGNSYTLTEIFSSNVTKKITVGDDVSETPSGVTTETFNDQVTNDEQDTESLLSTISSVDPSTGVTTTITVNESLTNTLHDQETDGDTHANPSPTSSNSTATDVRTMAEGGTDTLRLQLSGTATRTNADGTTVTVPAGSGLPQSVHVDITDTATSTNGVVKNSITLTDSTGDDAPTFGSNAYDFTVPIGSTPTGMAVSATGKSGDPVTYSISGTTDATIDPTTGILTFTGPVTTCSDFSVTATDTVTGSSATENVHINAVDASLLSSCFAPGTPIRVPGGFKKIEEIQAGDYVLARDEHRPDSPVVQRKVELTFHADGQLCELTIAGRTIQTTPEHRFHLHGGDWVETKELQPGSQLTSLDGPPLTVDSINPMPILTRVYNMRVAEDHTYFVGEEAWGWSVWAHNECDASPFGTNRTTWQWFTQAVSDTFSTETFTDLAKIGPSWVSDYLWPDFAAATMFAFPSARGTAAFVFVTSVTYQEAIIMDNAINGRDGEIRLDLKSAAENSLTFAPLGPLGQNAYLGTGILVFFTGAGAVDTVHSYQNENYVQGTLSLGLTGAGVYSLGSRYLPTHPSKNSEAFRQFSDELIKAEVAQNNITRVGKPKAGVSEIDINRLKQVHDVPRKAVPEGHIDTLAAKINAEGYDVNQPVTAYELPNGDLVIRGGHHRLEAMRKLGESTVPVRTYKAGAGDPVGEAFILEIGRATGKYKSDYFPKLTQEQRLEVDSLLSKFKAENGL